MNILILSCNTGEGHNSAAAALQEAFLQRGICCETVDALSLISPLLSRMLCGIHTFAYRRAPKTFSVGYRLKEKYPGGLFERMFRQAKPLRDFLRQKEYDAVICVHVFAATMMTELRRRDHVPKLYFVATDYTCSPGVGKLDVDVWFVPHEALRGEFMTGGVAQEKIVPTGIPVSRCFLDKTECSLARRSLGLPETGQMVLLCCGSMGCGPMEAMAEGLAERLPPDAFSVVICGTNETLRKKLEKRGLPRTYVLGYTAAMSLYMDAADLCLTKSGGLSTAEALEKELPLLYVDAVGGCESRNREFMLSRGFALGAAKNEDLPTLAAESLAHPDRLEEMLRRRGGEAQRRSADRIVDYVLAGT